MWSEVILGAEVGPWVWDTQLVSHLLDNRPNITSLKFQTYIQFGIPDYDSEISSFLKSKSNKKSANNFNEVKKAPRKKLLVYNGLDAHFTHKLYLLQLKQVQGRIKRNHKFRKSLLLFHKGAQALSEARLRGIKVDVKYCKHEIKRLVVYQGQ